MQDGTVARNYAEALHALATKAGDVQGWGRMIDAIAEAMRADITMRRFLESPRIDAARKNATLSRAFQDQLPRVFVKYLQILVTKRRQMGIPAIAVAYRTLLDEAANRVHADVTVARPMDEAATANLAASLSAAFKKDVVAHVTVDPQILGGAVVRIGDQVMDGSVRRRLAVLRQRMLTGKA
jgi:F-type H+-transporting ATPase subunit delta